MSFPLDEQSEWNIPLYIEHTMEVISLKLWIWLENPKHWNTYYNFCDYCEQRGFSELLKKYK